MTTPTLCPECGAAVRGVDFRAGAGDVAAGETPDLTEYVFLPCGHPAVDGPGTE